MTKQSGLEIFLQGRVAQRNEHATKEQSKLHTLRAGSAGCLLASNAVLGGCPHNALGRFLGYQLCTELAEEYFDAGVTNEHIYERNFMAALGKDRIKCEEEIPVRMEVAGYPLTGRPDIVVGEDREGLWVPTQGFELKSAHTIKSASKRLYGREVSADHLCQAGIYSRLLDCDYSIIYDSTVSGALPRWAANQYGYTDLVPGKIEFPIKWKGDKLYYYLPNGKEVETIITWTGILDYYSLIVEMYKAKKVGVVGRAAVDATGMGLFYNPNLYNDFTLAIDVENGWDTFIANLTAAASIRKKIEYAKGTYKVINITYDEATGSMANKYYFLIDKSDFSTYNSLGEARDAYYEE